MKSKNQTNKPSIFPDTTNVEVNPISQFRIWFDEVVSAGILEPAAMTLATSTKKGIPSARIVLMKKFDKWGFVFFTNYKSKKAIQIDVNPNAALVFHWKEFERQVRIEGKIVKISPKESNKYFNSRPILSNVSAVISLQSKTISSREYLESLFNEYKVTVNNKKIKRPENWGGYRLSPLIIEFWQGRENRLHDRIVYYKRKNRWQIKRLAP
jgi:pyridoxamine 5'-phosphate oxidase